MTGDKKDKQMAKFYVKWENTEGSVTESAGKWCSAYNPDFAIIKCRFVDKPQGATITVYDENMKKVKTVLPSRSYLRGTFYDEWDTEWDWD